MHYKEYELTLHSGDSLFLYTDGVPEAMNTAGVLYGMQRMLDTLNRCAKQQLHSIAARIENGYWFVYRRRHAV